MSGMGQVSIRYYVVLKGRGYWRPNARMKAAGFEDMRCGPDGPSAWAIAETWNARWDAERSGANAARERNTRQHGEIGSAYPPGSVGAAFKAYIQTEEWAKKAPGTRDKIWWPAWGRIRDTWGDCDPNTISFEQMSRWRARLEAVSGRSVAHKTLKVWRSLWVIMLAMKMARGEDPSAGIRNTAPLPRHQTWEEREALQLVKTAWRAGYRGLACIVAVTWDTLFQPVDVRTLKARHRRARTVLVERDGRTLKLKQRYFDLTAEGRAKTGRPAIGTVGRRTARLIDAYLAGIEPLPDSVLFRTRTGKPYGPERLSRDFAEIRALVYPGEKRELRDMRRAGTVEAVAGGADGGDLASKLANSIDRSNTLRKTYAPVEITAVVNADEARLRGRKRRAAGNESW